MKLLLDTHTLIWVFTANSTLSKEAHEAISSGENIVYVSSVTAWEIAIKRSLGKLKLSGSYQKGLEQYRFIPLDITTEHALAVEALPQHHKDPFDRMLIAQALSEKLTFVTRDSNILLYDVNIIIA